MKRLLCLLLALALTTSLALPALAADAEAPGDTSDVYVEVLEDELGLFEDGDIPADEEEIFGDESAVEDGEDALMQDESLSLDDLDLQPVTPEEEELLEPAAEDELLAPAAEDTLLAPAGNTYGTAVALTLNKAKSIAAPAYNYEEWYKFTLTTAGIVQMNFTHARVDNGSTWSLHLYTTAGAKQGTSNYFYSKYFDSELTSSTSTKIGLNKGTYYVKLWPGLRMAHTIKVSFTAATTWEKEPNDSYATANNLAMGKIKRGTVHRYDNGDWFKFSLGAASAVTLAYTQTNPTTDSSYLYLYKSTAPTSSGTLFSHTVASDATKFTSAPVWLAKGTYYVKLSSSAEGMSYTLKVSKSAPKLSKDAVTLGKNKSVTLTVKGRDDAYGISGYKWTSSNTKVATVSGYSSGTGYVYTKGVNGKATITCTKSGLKATCIVYVGTKVKSVSLNKTTASVAKGKTITLKATVAPSTAANKKVIWTSANTKIATVSSTGVVKGIAKGKSVKITAKTQDGGKTKVCTVKVT